LRVAKQWELLPHEPVLAGALSQGLNVSPVLGQLLVNRGLREPESARKFLAAPLSALHDPSQLPGVDAAAKRIHQAATDGKRICIYGDYDVDGITGTTILWRCLQLAGAKEASKYIPHRLEEGYGLNVEALRQLHRQGYQMIVTVDCGITSVAEAEEARQLGLELIITDHHELKAQLPNAQVLVHPRLPDSAYPFGSLCGAGVAFKLAWAICREFSQAKKVSDAFQKFLLESMALVALGTVADVVPLVDENRVFVRHGLKSLAEGPSLGLQALLAAAELGDGKVLNAGHIGFSLAPRLNAAGRLGQGILAVELLACTSEPRARDLARHLNEQNEVRQKIERSILHQARERIEAELNLDQTSALVLDDADWHPGVIGIVAGRLVERYARPVLLISSKEEVGQGSGRSVAGFPLHQALAACGEHLVSHGGHAAAAGFKVRRAAIPALRERFCHEAQALLNGKPCQPKLTIDAEVPLSALTLGLLKGIDALEPHGSGNRRPVFMTGGLQIVGEPKKVGKGELHLSFFVKQADGPKLKAIAFSMAERLPELLAAGGQCCLAYTPKRNEWQGYVNVDLEVVDFQAGAVATFQ
jgi:single-stranded-DNA-specific exonuclease